ncbi:MAG TPA: hypothetical protein VHR45_17365 [Thermoanaerobaculia bacterium]|nr:hypothetical protein [Thermoanaerobaculia bacterium]
MSQAEEETKTESAARRRRTPRGPLLVVLALLLVLGGFHLFYAEQKHAYLVHRDFRLLDAMGRQVAAAVAGQGQVLASMARIIVPPDPPGKTLGKTLDGEMREFHDALDLKVHDPRSCGPASPQQDGLIQSLEVGPEGTKLQLRYQEKEQADKKQQPSEERRVICGWVALHDLLAPILDPRKAFDIVLLVSEQESEVIAQQSDRGMSLHLSDLLPETEEPAKAKGDDKAAGSTWKALLPALRGPKRELDVKLHGDHYLLFAQPLSVAAMAAGLPARWVERAEARLGSAPPPGGSNDGAKTANGSQQSWLVVGLVSSHRMFQEALAISPSLLGAAVAMLLLSLLSWPLLKLKLLGERQRVRLADLLLIALCSLLGVSVATLLVLDFDHHRELGRLADHDLERFAMQISSHFKDEIRCAYVQLEELERLGPDHVNHTAADLYPFWESFTVFDKEGDKPPIKIWRHDDDLRFRPSDTRSHLKRDYFQRTLRGDLWELPTAPSRPLSGAACPGAAGATGPEPRFALESLVSPTRGVQMAVLAKPVSAVLPSQFAVATLVVPMLSAIRPVAPPGFEFAVIDRAGLVLFHSDPERNLSENFFREAEDDRRLESAVFARHRATVDLRYWGEDYRVSILPLESPPWTIVALRAKGRIEATNLETVLTALVLLLAQVSGFALVLAAVALARPSYRPEWLWPDPERASDYLRLVIVLLLLCAAFLIAACTLPGDARLVGAAGLLPLLALVMGYLQLTRRGRRRPGWELKRNLAIASGLVLLGIVFMLLATPLAAGWRLLGSLPLLAAGFLVFVHPRRWSRLTSGRALPLALSYPVLGFLLLVLTAVLPTLSFFKMAQAIQTSSLVKLGQLELARELDERRVRASSPAAQRPDPLGFDEGTPPFDRLLRPIRVAGSLPFYGGSFFATQLAAPSPRQVPELQRLGQGEGDAAGRRTSGGEEELLPQFLEDLLPTYSAYTSRTRALLQDRASDESWRWDRIGDRLELEPRSLGLKLSSSLPPAWPFAGALSGISAAPGALSSGINFGSLAAAGGAMLLLLALLVGLSCFIARRVFLVDLFEPLWSGQEGELPVPGGGNLFVVNSGQQWHLRDPERSFCRVHCKELEDDPSGWPARDLPERDVLVEGFEYRILDSAFNERKLDLLEALVRDRAVVVLSAVSPMMLLAPPDVGAGSAAGGARDARDADIAGEHPSGNEERWRALLSSFTVIDSGVLPRTAERDLTNLSVRSLRKMWRRLRGGAAAGGGDRFRSALLRKECGDNPFLLQIGCELDLLAPRLERQQLLDEFYERAEGYYRSLWASCSRDEKVVLGHLAEDGLVNEKNRRVVRRLMARGLVRREPVFRLLNETFRRFVASPACHQEVLQLEPTEPSAWDRVRQPFFVVLAAGAVFFLGTQKGLLDGTTSLVAAFTAGLPVLVKVADLVGSRRAGAVAK